MELSFNVQEKLEDILSKTKLRSHIISKFMRNVKTVFNGQKLQMVQTKNSHTQK